MMTSASQPARSENELTYEVERDRWGVMFSGELALGECIEVVPKARLDRLRALLEVAVTEYADHQSWRCGHPDRYSHDPDCPCGLVAFERDARQLLAEGGEGA